MEGKQKQMKEVINHKMLPPLGNKRKGKDQRELKGLEKFSCSVVGMGSIWVVRWRRTFRPRNSSGCGKILGIWTILLIKLFFSQVSAPFERTYMLLKHIPVCPTLTLSVSFYLTVLTRHIKGQNGLIWFRFLNVCGKFLVSVIHITFFFSHFYNFCA